MKKKILVVTVMLIVVVFYLLHTFMYNTKYAVFPFSEANSVEILYYKHKISGGANFKKIHEIPTAKKVILNNSEIEELFQILNKGICFLEYSASCYEPRHAIIFKKNNKIIGYIEICLECVGSKTSEGIERVILCDSRLQKLSEFFNAKSNP